MKLASFYCWLAGTALALSSAADASAEAKYVFYFIGDGMGMGHVELADAYIRDVVKRDSTLLMLQFPVASQVRTFSANSPVTDSAAAGTALSTGHKTNNSTVGLDAEGNPVYSIASDFLHAGYEVGVASTVPGDDATPAAFYAHAESRHQRKEIADYAVTSGFSFLGAPTFRAMNIDGKPTDWLERMQCAGYKVAYGYDEAAKTAATPGRTLMLSANPQGDQAGYTIDSIPGAMNCAQLTRACLATLETNIKANKAPGFFMMVEAGNIDWAAHANDGGAVIKEVLNFQNAISVAYDFYLQHPEETLIVITADHDTGGASVGCNATGYNAYLRLVDFQKISKDRFTDYCRSLNAEGKMPDWAEMSAFLRENLGFWQGVEVTPEEEKELNEVFDRTFVRHESADQKSLYKDFDAFTAAVYRLLNSKMGVGFTSLKHTGNFVPMYAVGTGSQLFTRNLNNTEIPGLIVKAALSSDY